MTTNSENNRQISGKKGSVVTFLNLVCLVLIFITHKGFSQNLRKKPLKPESNIIEISVNNISICAGQTGTLMINGNADNYRLISNNSTVPVINNSIAVNPEVSTTYTISGTLGQITASTTVNVFVASMPNLVINADKTTICEGDSITFTTSGASSYNWGYSNSLYCSISGAIIAVPKQSTVYTIIGSNTLLDATCSNTSSINITVLPKTKGTVSDNVNICKGASTTLNAQGGNSIVWSPALGLNSSITSSPKASPIATTIYTAQISNNGICPDTKTVSVTVNPIPNVDAGNDTTILYSKYATLTGTGEGKLIWHGEGLTCNTCSKVYLVPLKSSYYTLEATNRYGCKNTDTKRIEVIKK